MDNKKQIILTPMVVRGIIGIDMRVEHMNSEEVFTVLLRCATQFIEHEAETRDCLDGITCLHKQDSIQWAAALNKLMKEHEEFVKQTNND